MRQNTLHNRGPSPWAGGIRTTLFGIALAVAFLFTLTLASGAADLPPFNGEFNPVSVGPGPAGQTAVSYPSAPAAGALVYDDFKRIEDRARFLLKRNLVFRDDISPYQGANNFDKLVRQFDTNGGFGAQYDDPDPTIAVMTMAKRVELADNELAEARDLYAYLAVFASPARFRSDNGSGDSIDGNDYKNALCNRAEDPNPKQDPIQPAPADPIIDWCNFPARLRQSVREGALLRMIFAQQFVVDAMGLNFSGDLVGGEDMVKKKELPKLQFAVSQYEEGEKRINQALGRVVGNGCYVSDFFTQSEWGLLSTMAQKKEVAQHQVAVRLSYLDIKKESDIPRQEAKALDAYRSATMETYIKMAGMAGRAALPPGSGCASTPPANALVAEIAKSMLETRARAREMTDGRNIFGFDIHFTPNRRYATNATVCTATNKGLWLAAKCLADDAEKTQVQVAQAGRDFDLNQQKLIEQINGLNTGLNSDIGSDSGCGLQGSNDAAFFACATEQIRLVSACDPSNAATFDNCLKSPLIFGSNLKAARRNMRTAWLELEKAQDAHENIFRAADIEKMRNTKVTSEMLTGAKETSAYEALIVAANCCAVTFGAPPEYQMNPGAFVEAGLRPFQILGQAAHDMKIEDTNSEAAVRTLFLGITAARKDIDLAFQHYLETTDDFDGVVGSIEENVFEAQRQRSYLIASPANDPGYRMVRDSLRLTLGKKLEKATRAAYLAARRAEYEYAAQLSLDGFRISDIYKARTADDITIFLNDLDEAISKRPGADVDTDLKAEPFTISMARHVLGWTDAYLQGEGFTGDGIEAERRRRFREWVGTHTAVDKNGDEVISFEFSTNSDTKGILSRVKQQGYDTFWLHKMAGIGTPLPTNTGAGLDIRTDQAGLPSRAAHITQAAQVELTSFGGCLFNYRLLPQAVMEGLSWPENQPVDLVPGDVTYNINGANGSPTPNFLGRPVAGQWTVEIFTGRGPNGEPPYLDLGQLNDIELEFSTTRAVRTAGPQLPAGQCIRVDF